MHTTDAIQIGLWYDHKDRALEATPSPRIIVVGGSSGLYGVDAKLLSERTGWPVVNYATHAALPLGYHLERALRVAKPGDVLLLNLEYGMLERQEPNVVSTHFILEKDPSYLADLPLNEAAAWTFSAEPSATGQRLWTLVAGEPQDAIRKLQADTERDLDAFGSHRRNQSSLQADYHRRMLDKTPPMRAWLFPGFFSDVLDAVRPQLETFAKTAAERRVELIATFPPIMEFPEYRERADALEKSSNAWIDLYQNVGIETVGSPQRSILPRSKFFDSIKHLNSESSQEYTEALGRELKDLLPKHDATAD